MNKEEILARSRNDNRLLDERDRRIADQASVWGAIGMGSVLAAIFLIRLLIKGGDPYDLLAMGFAYLAVANAYRWHATGERKTLLLAVLHAAISLGWLGIYAFGG